MNSLANSRSGVISIVLVLIAGISNSNGFSMSSRGFPSRSSQSALNYAERPISLPEYKIQLEGQKMEPEEEKTLNKYFLDPRQEIDLHGLEELAPLERHLIRMEGLEPYVLVSVLTSTTSYGTISGLSLFFPDGHLDFMATLLLACATLSTTFGIYATAVFSMSVLYGKTALGLGKDDVYFKFMENTTEYRVRGYKAFTTSLGLFVTDIFLIGIDKLPHELQGLAAMFGIGATVFGYKEFIEITKAAAPMFQEILGGEGR